MRYVSASALFQRVYGYAGTSGEVTNATPRFEMAEDLLDMCLRTTLTAESGAKRVNGTGSGTIWLPKHLRSATLVEVLNAEGEWETLDMDYVLVQKSLRIVDGATPPNPLYYAISVGGYQNMDDVFPEGIANVRVTGEWGCAPNGSLCHVPKIILGALAILVRRVGQEEERNPSVRIDSGANRLVEYFSPADATFSSLIGGAAETMLAGYSIVHSLHVGNP